MYTYTPGVVLQHIKFTNLFESSMQLINPSVALPYWEFTADNAKGFKYNNEMMTAAYFGKMYVPTDVSNGFTYTHDKIEDGVIQVGNIIYKKLIKTTTMYVDRNYSIAYKVTYHIMRNILLLLAI